MSEWISLWIAGSYSSEELEASQRYALTSSKSACWSAFSSTSRSQSQINCLIVRKLAAHEAESSSCVRLERSSVLGAAFANRSLAKSKPSRLCTFFDSRMVLTARRERDRSTHMVRYIPGSTTSGLVSSSSSGGQVSPPKSGRGDGESHERKPASSSRRCSNTSAASCVGLLVLHSTPSGRLAYRERCNCDCHHPPSSLKRWSASSSASGCHAAPRMRRSSQTPSAR
mmetsp:Transcript_65636/g.109054  ORF Transcript_65636/g.109054 Transcript_65636/m.109054 type:complete len:227 (-) Transcript_65636:693-1373(-)